MKKKTIAIVLFCALFVVMTTGAGSSEPAKTAPAEAAPLGVVGEEGYVNEYFGVGFDLPEEWSFYTDEELAEMMNVTVQVIQDEEFQELMTKSMEDGNAVTNMAAKDSLGLHNVNMRVTKMTDDSLLSFSEETILEMLTAPVKEMLESAGYEDLELEIGEVEFAGQTKPILYITGRFYNIPMYQGELLLLGEEYYAVLTFTSAMENELDEQFVQWHALEEEAAEATA